MGSWNIIMFNLVRYPNFAELFYQFTLPPAMYENSSCSISLPLLDSVLLKKKNIF